MSKSPIVTGATSITALPANQVEVTTEGDSITYGVNLAAGDSWPADFSKLTGLVTDNIGVSGYLLANMVANFSSRTGAHYDAAKVDNEVFLLGGANDVIYNHATAAQLEAYVTNFASAAIAQGFDKIWVGTIMDGTSRWYDSAGISQIHEFNSWLRSNYASVGISGVVDYAAQPGLSDPSNTAYFQDGLHPTAAGASIMAATAQAARNSAAAISDILKTAQPAASASSTHVDVQPAVSKASSSDDTASHAIAVTPAVVTSPVQVVAAPAVAEPAAVVKAPVATTAAGLTLHVSGDLWNGGPQFTVSVDGHQVGGVHEVTADHASGALQDITIDAALGAGTHTVAVSFLNDGHGYATYDAATGWHANDRNLYVEGVKAGGAEFGVGAVTSNTAPGGYEWLDPHAAVMVANGVATFAVQVDAAHASAASAPAVVATPAPAAPSSVATSDTLTFRVSGDLWQGGPKFTVSVDGHQLAGVHEVTADHGTGSWQDVSVTGNFGAGAHSVAVSFVNDDHGAPVFDPASGWHVNDRNLYVSQVSLDGAAVDKSALTSNTTESGYDWLDPHAVVMVSNGTAVFAVQGGIAAASPTTGADIHVTAATPAAAAVASGSDTLSFRVSGDLWQGGPEFKVLVDGRALDGVHDVTASHGAGAWQDISLTGAFGSGPHVVDVTMLNDGHGTPVFDPVTGWQMNDRNLYVSGVALNGHAYDVTAMVANNASNGCDYLDPHAAVLVANGTASFLLS